MVKKCISCGKEKKVIDNWEDKVKGKAHFVCTPCFEAWISEGIERGKFIKSNKIPIAE